MLDFVLKVWEEEWKFGFEGSRSFWISTFDCWSFFWGRFFISGGIFLFFFPRFWDFQSRIWFFLVFFSLGLFFNQYFVFIFIFFSLGWKAWDHGPWIHLRCLLPVCVAWGGEAFHSFQASPPWSRRWKWRWTMRSYRCPGQWWHHRWCGPVQPFSSGWFCLWPCWCSHAQLWRPESPPLSAPPIMSITSITSMALRPLPSTGCPFLHVGVMVRSSDFVCFYYYWFFAFRLNSPGSDEPLSDRWYYWMS